MDAFTELAALISLSMGVAWASGINLYAAILVLGLGGATGNIELPETLSVVQDPMVIGAAGLMYCIEFFADKTPGVDSGWDAIHTFIRIPAGAMLAASSVGDVSPALQVTAGMLGGTLTAATHATKASTRVAINTSPEPFSNWAASLTEDVAVFAGLWAALNHPFIFLGLLAVFILLMIWLLPKLWKLLKAIFRKIRSWFGGTPAAETKAGEDQGDPLRKLSALKQLLDDGAITAEEYQQQKQRLIGEL